MQTFILTNPDTKEVINTADNLNKYSHDYIKSVIEKQIEKESWNPTARYIASGSDGDIVIYHNGVVDIS